MISDCWEDCCDDCFESCRDKYDDWQIQREIDQRNVR